MQSKPANPNPNGPSHHRRARSEVAFRIPDEFADPGSASHNLDEIGSEDDLFCTFMDMEKIGCRLEGSGSGSDSQDPTSEGLDERKNAVMLKPKHRYSSSMDGSSAMMRGSEGGGGGGMFGEMMEAKKAMSAEQLAELAAIDPKRAKR